MTFFDKVDNRNVLYQRIDPDGSLHKCSIEWAGKR